MVRILSKKRVPYKGKVIDLQIENDPSYNVSGVVVHNSAAGSLIAYLIGITQINPFDYDLLFERFLNRGRMGEWKDVEILKCVDENGEEIEITPNKKYNIIRNKKEIWVLGSEIEKDDEILG